MNKIKTAASLTRGPSSVPHYRGRGYGDGDGGGRGKGYSRGMGSGEGRGHGDSQPSGGRHIVPLEVMMEDTHR